MPDRFATEPEDAVEGRSASMAVTDALRRTILRGGIPAGEKLRQDAIAARFGVSQTIVREAFKQLVNEGFLRAEPRRGVSVAPLTAREAEEMTQLRSLLEAQALRWAIPEMRESDFKLAERILEQLDEAATTDDIISLNAKFHETLYAPARRERTFSIISTLRLNFERYLRFTWEETSHLVRSQREHREILSCCRMRAVDEACVRLQAHTIGTGSVLAERLKRREGV